jgi:serine/tyrosine/threonine adenylyltransferase
MSHQGFNFDNSYKRLSPSLFSVAQPMQVPKPSLVLYNDALAADLGIGYSSEQPEQLAPIFSGQQLPDGAEPIAQAYAGHQFGHFTMLGDGRAILLGEHLTPDGRRVDIQLKGAGQTMYSRRGDGQATLSAVLREYLISEAMHYLRIPTSRSLAVAITGTPVYRESVHHSGVLTRVMTSHIRVGTFEYVANFLPPEQMPPFLDYVVARHYPALADVPNKALALLEAVMHRQIALIVDWMRVGFIHGVMNTDNMAIAGETFDYGPCAFMNGYNPKTVFSSVDTNGRYAFENQPLIAHWNLACLASALVRVIDTDEAKAVARVRELLDTYPDLYKAQWWRMMSQKIGFDEATDDSKTLVAQLLQWMEAHRADYTHTFLMLQGDLAYPDDLYQHPLFAQWVADWKAALQAHHIEFSDALALMRKTNPVYIPRNHLVEQALDEACNRNDFSLYSKMLGALQRPYTRHESSDFLQLVPEAADAGYHTFCNT